MPTGTGVSESPLFCPKALNVAKHSMADKINVFIV